MRTVMAALLLLCLLAGQAGKSFASDPGDDLLLGIEPEHNIFDQMERYRDLAKYMSDLLGIKVKLTIMSRYGEVIKRFRVRHLDGAFLSSYTAAKGIRDLGLVPVASPVHRDGQSTSQGYIFVRKDSGIADISDMEGKRVAFVDPATTEGYLFPLVFFRRHGITDKESFFGGFYFTGSHASALFAVLDGRADIGAAKDTVFRKQIELDPFIGEELTIMAKSPKVPEITLCIRPDLPAKLQERLHAVLLHMDTTTRGRSVLERFGALRFIQSSAAEFEVVMQMADTAGISLAE